MFGSANVQSSEAIEAVKAALIFFKNQVEQALTTNELEMRRVLDWLEHDRPRYWKTRVRVAHDEVTAAKAALTRCLMYPINDERPSCYEERAAVKKAGPSSHIAGKSRSDCGIGFARFDTRCLNTRGGFRRRSS